MLINLAVREWHMIGGNRLHAIFSWTKIIPIEHIERWIGLDRNR